MGNRTMEDWTLTRQIPNSCGEKQSPAAQRVLAGIMGVRISTAGSRPCSGGKTDLPLLELEGSFRTQAQCRHKSRMAAIEIEPTQRSESACLEGPDQREVTTFPEVKCNTGEQVKESINRKTIGWKLQESLVLKGAIIGIHREQRRSSVVKNKFGRHHQTKSEMREMMMRRGADDPDPRKKHTDHNRDNRI